MKDLLDPQLFQSGKMFVKGGLKAELVLVIRLNLA